jgi:endoribonuclease Dicer
LPSTIPLAWCSPNVESLVKVTLKYTFQRIIFVEQRQVASTLGRLLETVSELQGTVRCAHLVGQGVNSEGVSRYFDRYQGDAVKLFRDKEINICMFLLIVA